MGIVPKMAVRFSSFEAYKGYLAGPDGKVSQVATFFAGLGSGVTEAILVVTPAEVCKIRLQAQVRYWGGWVGGWILCAVCRD